LRIRTFRDISNVELIKMVFQVHLILPRNAKMPLALSDESLATLDELRKSCGVEIRGERSNTVICITGSSPTHVRAAIHGINHAIHGLKVEEASGRQRLLVQPLAFSSLSHGKIVLHPPKGPDGGGRRPILCPGDPDAEPGVIEQITMEQHKEKIYGLFRDSMDSLQTTHCELHMGINFGAVKLFQREIDQVEFDIRQFVELANHIPGRTIARLDTRYYANSCEKSLLAVLKIGRTNQTCG
jgi:hypothetical protein